MRHVDVIFPLNLGPLTYGVPEALEGTVFPGMMVRAEIKKSLKKGIVLGPASARPRGPVKFLRKPEGEKPALTGPMLTLIQWMSAYYYAKEGAVLKSILPREFFEPVTPRGDRRPLPVLKNEVDPYSLGETEQKNINDIQGHARGDDYKTFLFQAHSTTHELAFMLEAIKGLNNVIILVPDHAWLRHIAGAVRAVVGEERLAVYHSGMSRGSRSEELRRILSGEADVAVGSRGAVFAPLRNVSFIAVLQEESKSYKEERGVRYNARDMAVMRGYREGAAVLLSSICPSSESFHNAMRKKYSLLPSPPPYTRPRIRVVDVRKTATSISPILRRAVEAGVKQGEKVMLYVNRRGFSMLECGDCGRFEPCPECNIPMVFYKGRRIIRCSYCGTQSAPPDVCPVCLSHELKPVGTGMERVEEEIRELEPVGVDGKSRRRLELVSGAEEGVAVGTKVLTRSPGLGGEFSLVGVINADAHLYIPDYRSAERAYQDLMYAADRVKPGGQMILQTRNPGSTLFSCLRHFNAGRFYREELRQREALQYPPYSKMVLLIVESRAEPALAGREFRKVEVLGPVASITKRGKKVWKILLKAPAKAELKPAVETMIEELGGGGVGVSIDVDPVEI